MSDAEIRRALNEAQRRRFLDSLKDLRERGLTIVAMLEIESHRARYPIPAPKWFWSARCRLGWHDRLNGQCVWCGSLARKTDMP